MSDQENEKKTGEEKTAAEQSPDEIKTEKKKTAPAHKRKRHKSNGGYTIGILLVLVVIGIGAAWFVFDYIEQYKAQITRLASHQTELQQENTNTRDEINSKLGILKEQQDVLRENISTLREKNKHLRKDWLLLEAEYLLQLANHRILLERDVNTAIAAIVSADERLRDTGDPGVIVVRRVVNEALQSLKKVPQTDLAGLSLVLSTINKDLETLPLSTPDPKSKEQEMKREAEEVKKVENWSELPAAVWRDLRSLVVIRDHEDPVRPLLSPEQRFFLIENLRLQLEQARLAMLAGQAKVYTERLATAIAWIEKYFDKQSTATKSTLDSLQQLVTAEIAPTIPDISYTYQALQNYRQGVKQPVKSQQPAKTDKTDTSTNGAEPKTEPKAE